MIVPIVYGSLGVLVAIVLVLLFTTSTGEKVRSRLREASDESTQRNADRRKQEALQRGEQHLAKQRRGQAEVVAGKKKVHAPISQVGDRSGGVLTCPKCGGSQFTAKRGASAKAVGAMTLVGGALMRKKRVRCVTCGTIYDRG